MEPTIHSNAMGIQICWGTTIVLLQHRVLGLKRHHNKIWCVFQPHTYTRTKTLWEDFCTCFKDADNLIITDIYAAREPFDGITTSEALAKAIHEAGKECLYIKEFEDIRAFLKDNVNSGDIVFTMGAGTITELGKILTMSF